jgi:hypothetical protein
MNTPPCSALEKRRHPCSPFRCEVILASTSTSPCWVRYRTDSPQGRAHDTSSPHSFRVQIMDLVDPSLYVFNTAVEAEDAIRSLGRAGFDVKKLSLIGKGYHSDQHPIGFYTAGDRIKSWGGIGAFWGAIWGLLLGPAVFFLPGIGLLALAGPVVAALVAALEGAAVVGGISALGAALMSLGVPEDQVVKYETAVKADKYVLVVHGSAEDAKRVCSVLAAMKSGEKA